MLIIVLLGDWFGGYNILVRETKGAKCMKTNLIKLLITTIITANVLQWVVFADSKSNSTTSSIVYVENNIDEEV